MQLKFPKHLKFYGVSFLTGAFGAGLVLCVSHAFKPKPLIASVNVNKIVSEYIEQNKKSTQDDMQLAVQSSRFMDALEQTMKSFSVKNKVTLVVSEAVITGAEDVTFVIRRDMEERLNG